MADSRIALEVDVNIGDLDERLKTVEGKLGDLGDLGEEAGQKVSDGFNAAGKNAENASKGIKSAAGGLGDMIKALGVIGIALQVFNFLKDILMKNQAVMDALNTATLAFEILVKKLFDSISSLAEAMKAAFEDPKQSIKDLGNFIVDNLINRFQGLMLTVEALGTTFKALFEADWDGAVEGVKDYGQALIQVGTGLDKEQQAAIVDGVKEFAEEAANATKAAVDEAAAIIRLENELKILEATQRKQILVSQNLAELERQKRDDISLTIAERVKANDKLGEILDDQLEIETGIAQKRLELAKRQAALDKTNVDLQAAVIDAETELADVRERINGQRSEQLVNQKALEKELADFQRELRLVGKSERELELEELLIEIERLAEIKRLANDTELDIEEEKRVRLAELQATWDAEDLAAKEKKAAEEAKLAEQEAKAIVEAEKKKQDAREAGLSAAGSVLNSLGQLVAASGEQSKEAVALQKAIAVAQIAIDTAKAVTGAIAQAQSVPYPANLVAIATGVAAVLGGIASATATLNSAPMGGMTAPAPPNANAAISSAAASAPSMQQVSTSTTELGGAEQAQLAPIQAFVVETEMTGNQNNISQIENQVTFGIDG